MKYPKFLQVLTLAAVTTSALPMAETSVYASDLKETPKEYEARTEYDLPEGYHYVLSDDKYVVFDDDGKVRIEKDEQKKDKTVKKAPEKKEVKESASGQPEIEKPENEEKKAEAENAKKTEDEAVKSETVKEDLNDPDREIITTEDSDTKDDQVSDGKSPDGEPGDAKDPEEEPGEGENPDIEPGEGENPSAEPGEGENPDVEPGNEENPDEESGKEENPGVGSGVEENTSLETGSGENPGSAEDIRRPGETGTETAARKPKAINKRKKLSGKQVKKTDILKPREKKKKFDLDFKRSKPFYEIEERICYNEKVPIEGIPSFITQEMIVGALKAQDETGYPASVTIAQIINESGYGKYGPGGDEGQGLSYLAYQYCNLFGIKGMGTAGSTQMNTKEMTSNGQTYSIQAGFRVYNTYTECIEDRSELLKNVYSDLTAGAGDANTFAVKIGGRWATGINYGQNLIKTMETYDLYRLDEMTLVDFSQLIGTFANPCPGSHITSNFGYRSFDNKFHKGLDMGTGAQNIPTYAAEAGTVVFAGNAGAAGNLITIDHGNGMVTKYMHHSQIYVKFGQKVEKGQQIGLSGTTGRSTGNHLHFQVEKNGIAMNPVIYLADEEMQAKAAE